MIFPKIIELETDTKEILANPTGSKKVFNITSTRITNSANSAYVVKIYLKNESVSSKKYLMEKNAMDAGDYIIDTTVFRLPPGCKLYADSTVPKTTVIIIDAYETDI
jgi:hypothetical protein